ncbi:MAG: helix-turn-helix domain-containing protein, partial [Bacteroidota bacterium]
MRLFSVKEFVDQQTKTTSDNKKYFKTCYESFFVGRIEEIRHLSSYPIPASKSTTHCIYYVDFGSIGMTKNVTEYQLGPGDCIVVPAYHISSIDSLSTDITGLFLSFSPDLLNGRFIIRNEINTFEYLMPYAQSHFMDLNHNSPVKHLLNRLKYEYDSCGLERSKLVVSYLVTLLYELYYLDTSNTQHGKIGQYENITQQFKIELFENVTKLNRTSDYADLIGITPNHLNKVLKATTGKSPIYWINQALILEAKVLLEETGLSVSEIGARIG